MKRILATTAVILLAAAALAQAPEPVPPDPVPPAPTPAPQPPPPPPPAPAVPSQMFYGGGFGLSFGTIDYISIAPLVGKHLSPRFDVALQPFYSYTNDDRFDPDFSANNYGVDVIARYGLFRNLFAEGRYEWISYEYRDITGDNERQSDSYPFAGGGYFMGRGRVGASFSALYNFAYDDDEAFRPYDSPWLFQVGVGVGF